MMVELPALDGRDPLGFLAALGVLRLLADEHDQQVQLSFSDTTGYAQLHSNHNTIEQLAGTLTAIAAAIPDDGALHGVDPRFPFRPPPPTRRRTAEGDRQPQPGDSADPLRVPRARFRQLAERVEVLDPRATSWLSCLVTDLAVDNHGRAAITPFRAPIGQQNSWTFFTKSLELVRAHPDRIGEALASWRRTDGCSGEYFDHRVLRSAADHPSGKSTEAGVPGATWLATQALPLLRVSGDGQAPAATLWLPGPMGAPFRAITRLTEPGSIAASSSPTRPTRTGPLSPGLRSRAPLRLDGLVQAGVVAELLSPGLRSRAPLRRGYWSDGWRVEWLSPSLRSRALLRRHRPQEDPRRLRRLSPGLCGSGSIAASSTRRATLPMTPCHPAFGPGSIAAMAPPPYRTSTTYCHPAFWAGLHCGFSTACA
jgi:hypothetical protein